MSFIHDGQTPGIAPEKDPDETVWYGAAWDKVVPQGTILTSTWLIPDGITLEDERVDEESDGNQRVNKILISGGENGKRYKVTNRVSFGDETYDRSMIIPVTQL